jgi:hypothetical protein
MMQSTDLIHALPMELLDELAVYNAGASSVIPDELLAGDWWRRSP